MTSRNGGNKETDNGLTFDSLVDLQQMCCNAQMYWTDMAKKHSLLELASA